MTKREEALAWLDRRRMSATKRRDFRSPLAEFWAEEVQTIEYIIDAVERCGFAEQ